MHRSSSVWPSLVAVMLHFLVNVVILPAKSLVLSTSQIKFLTHVLQLNLCFPADLAKALKISYVIRGYTMVSQWRQ